MLLKMTKNKQTSSTTLFCFSPPVMIVTFVVEIIMAVWVLWRYGLDHITRLVALILVNLAIFQLAEYFICTGALGLTDVQWARIGHVAITLLPPLGLHLGLRLAKKRNPALLAAAYGTAAAFGGLFLLSSNAVQEGVCLGNYVIFERGAGLLFWPWSYALYYYGWLFAGVYTAWTYAANSNQRHLKRALYGLMAGYLAFIVPTTAVNLIDPSTITGIPSIMCGFAVMLAFALTFWVVPEYRQMTHEKRRRKLASTK